MIKKISLFSLIAFLICPKSQGGATNCYQFERKTFDDNFSLKKADFCLDSKGETKEFTPPCYEDYENIGQNGIDVYSEDAVKDKYEDNNSITMAKCISPSYDGESAAKDYNVTIYATIHRNELLWGLIKKEVDEDYYRFNVYGKSKTTINLSNIPVGCDYDLELYEHVNRRYAELDQVSLVARSAFVSNNDEKISVDLLPGVYYLRVNSYNDTFNAKEEYKLSLNVDYYFEDVSISELRYSKGIGAALWVSDYDPFGIYPFALQSKSEVGFYCFSQYYSVHKFGNPMFQYIRDEDGIKHASLYIWDLNLRKILYEIVKTSIIQLESDFSDDEQIRITLDVTSDIVNGISVIVGLALVFVPVANPALLTKVALNALGVTATVLPTLLDCIFETIMPQNLLERKSNYLNYLRTLSAALESNSSTSDQEVIKIDSNYKITDDSSFGVVQVDYDIDFTPMVQPSYLYDCDIIPAFQEDAKFNGTVYPLKTLDDINNARKKNAIDYSDVNTGGNEKLSLDVPFVAEINTGEYKWYHFTAPENGKYTFQTNSQMDTYGELFPHIVPGYSSDERINFDDDGGNERNFSITVEMFKDRTIYLRVRGYNWKASGLYSLSVSKTDEIELIEESISDQTFGFQNEYVDDLNRKPVSLDSGFNFTTQRIRCGYINNQYLTLSAKCKNAGLAYLQMDFTKDIQSFDFEMAIWSDEEYLNQKSSIVLETKDRNGIYNVEHTFNIAEMSKNKDSLDPYSFVFNKETYGVRISVRTNQVNYEKNKGRVVLSNFVLRHI